MTSLECALLFSNCCILAFVVWYYWARVRNSEDAPERVLTRNPLIRNRTTASRDFAESRGMKPPHHMPPSTSPEYGSLRMTQSGGPEKKVDFPYERYDVDGDDRRSAALAFAAKSSASPSRFALPSRRETNRIKHPSRSRSYSPQNPPTHAMTMPATDV